MYFNYSRVNIDLRRFLHNHVNYSKLFYIAYFIRSSDSARFLEEVCFSKEENGFIQGFNNDKSDSDDSDTDENIEESCALMITVVILIS